MMAYKLLLATGKRQQAASIDAKIPRCQDAKLFWVGSVGNNVSPYIESSTRTYVFIYIYTYMLPQLLSLN